MRSSERGERDRSDHEPGLLDHRRRRLVDHRHADRDLGRRCADGDGEASQNVAEGATVTGTLDFVQGADGASVTHIGGIPLVFNAADDELFAADRHRRRHDQGEGGRVVLVHGGQPGDSARALASASFTVTDGDGDTVTVPVSFPITDANVPTTGTASAAVDDDGLVGPPAGNPASMTNDLNANIGDNLATPARRRSRACWAAAWAATARGQRLLVCAA